MKTVNLDKEFLREMAQAFAAVGGNLSAAEGMLKDHQEYSALTHVQRAIEAYRRIQNDLKIYIPDEYWGLDLAPERKPVCP